MNPLSEKNYTLLLNKMWQPLRIVTAAKAIHFFVEDGVVAIDPETYEQHDFNTWVAMHNDGTRKYERGAVDNVAGSRYVVPVPSILLLRKCNSISSALKKAKKGGQKFSKKKVFERDNNTCGYCLDVIHGDEKTIDHVVPQSLGGKTTYGNVVTCCKECNSKKADTPFKELQKQGWTLHHKLLEPECDILHFVPKRYRQECWNKFIK